jgi:hypothetical protein
MDVTRSGTHHISFETRENLNIEQLLGTDFGGRYVSRKARKYSLNFKSIFQWKSCKQLQSHVYGIYKNLLSLLREPSVWRSTTILIFRQFFRVEI